MIDFATELDGQEVLDFYGSYEREAAELDARIRTLNDDNYADQQLVTDLENATREEAAPGMPDLERLYEKQTSCYRGCRFDVTTKFDRFMIR